MSNSEPIIRIYNVPDPEMLQYSRVMQGIFVEDKVSFVEYDADFADPFADNWLAKINESGEMLQDTFNVDKLSELTNNTQKKLDGCRKTFQGMKHFIESISGTGTYLEPVRL